MKKEIAVGNDFLHKLEIREEKMSKVPQYAELEQMELKDLIKKHDKDLESYSIDSSFYLREIYFRKNSEMTKQIRIMTIAMLIIAFLNLIFIIFK